MRDLDKTLELMAINYAFYQHAPRELMYEAGLAGIDKAEQDYPDHKSWSFPQFAVRYIAREMVAYASTYREEVAA